MFEKEAKERAKDIYIHHFDDDVNYPDVLKAITVGVQKGAEHGYNKANEELEEKISVLLSCKNCPENKDGLICQKEYENKCLAQKIQFIKELQQENVELKSIADFQTSSNMDRYFQLKRSKEQLTKAKEILKILLHKLIMAKAPYKTDLTKEEIAGLRNLIGEREEDLKLEDK